MDGMDRDGQRIDGAREWVLSSDRCLCDKHCKLRISRTLRFVPPDTWVLRTHGHLAGHDCSKQAMIELVGTEEACELLREDGLRFPLPLMTVPEATGLSVPPGGSSGIEATATAEVEEGCGSDKGLQSANGSDREPEAGPGESHSKPSEATSEQIHAFLLANLTDKALCEGSLPPEERTALKQLIADCKEDLKNHNKRRRQRLSRASFVLRTVLKEGQSSRRAAPRLPSSPAGTPACPVVLKDRNEFFNAVVAGKETHLSYAQYETIKLLIIAYPGGLKTAEINEKLKNRSGRDAVMKLPHKEVWKGILLSPGCSENKRLTPPLHCWRLAARA